MPESWRIRLGIGIIVVGVVFSAAVRLEMGGLIVLFGIFWCAQGMVGIRRSRQTRQSAGAVAEQKKDFLERLDRGESLDQVAQEYERLHKIPPASTLLYLASLIRAYVGVGRDVERNQLARIILDRQARTPAEPADRSIESFSFATNVFFVDESARYYPNPNPSPSKPAGGKRGIFLVARHYLYFFADPGQSSVEGEFVKGLAKERVLDWTGVPYGSLATAGLEVIEALWEGMRDYFKPEVIERLKKLFRQPESFAAGLSTIVDLQKLQMTQWGLPRERLVIRTKDEAGHEAQYCFGSSAVFDNRWTTGVAELIATITVLNGALLTLYGAEPSASQPGGQPGG